MPFISSLRPLLLGCCLAFFALPASAKTLPEVQAMVESKAPGALAAADALTKTTPNDANAWVMLVRARLQARQAGKAIVAGEKATALGPRNAQAFYWLGNAYGNRLGEVGMVSKMSMAPKLRDAFEQAVRLDPALIDARSSLIEFYLQAPGMMGGGIDKARAQAVAIAKYDRARGFTAQARIAMHEKKPAEALKAYEQALAMKPDDAQLRLALVMGYQQAKRWREAYAMARQWVSEEPRKATPRYQIGRIAAESGEYLPEGEAALRVFLTLARETGDPEPKHARYRLGQVLAKAGRKDEARAELQAALKIDSKFKEAKDALAVL
ncbi:MAG: tetratricopeptide repeat protein [Thermomonas sp.]